MTITHTYSSTAETSPGRVAIQTESEQITYHDWDRLVSQTANWYAVTAEHAESCGDPAPK